MKKLALKIGSRLLIIFGVLGIFLFLIYLYLYGTKDFGFIVGSLIVIGFIIVIDTGLFLIAISESMEFCFLESFDEKKEGDLEKSFRIINMLKKENIEYMINKRKGYNKHEIFIYVNEGYLTESKILLDKVHYKEV